MDVYVVVPGALIVIGALVVARALLIPNDVTVDDLLTRTDLAWPRGVQEEEPVRWRIERLTPPGRRGAGRPSGDPAARPSLAAPRNA